MLGAPTHRLAVMPGDGVGPELISQALRVLEALAHADGFTYELVHFPHSAQHYQATGETLGTAAVEQLRACDSLLFGAIGDPALPAGMLERAIILGIAAELELWLGIRGAYLHHADLTPLKDVQRGDIDMVIVRDVTEGELAIPGGTIQPGTPYEARTSIIAHTRYAVDRAIRYAFELARTRKGKVSLVAQSNVLIAHQLWEERLDVLAPEYPDVESEALYPDHAMLKMVMSPGSLDVIVTTLLFGGILSDLMGGVVGGIGLIGSVRFNPDTRFGLYEPAHGSAPKYAGLDVVSPMATFNALAMLLQDRGESRSAQRLRFAIDDVLASGRAGLTARTGVGTIASTDLVLESLARSAPG